MKVVMLSNQCGPAVRLQVEGLRSLGVNVIPVIVDRARLGRWAYLDMRRLLKQQVDAIRPDIVHVQFGGVQAAIAALAIPKRCIVSYHGTDLHGGSRSRSCFSRVSKRLGVWCSRFAIRHTAYSIVVSESLLKYIPADCGTVCTITTGVDYECFKPLDRGSCLKDLGLDSAVPKVLFCDSSHDPVKRRDLADVAIEKLRTAGIECELLELNNVCHEKVPLYLNASYCLLVTSDKEGSPNIVKEALACNIPVISVDVGDVADRIRNINGCYICERDSVSLAKALRQSLAGLGRCESRELVRSDIDNKIICKRLFTLYEAICGAKN
ncbi:MAG: glycosyltransferase [bacterium]